MQAEAAAAAMARGRGRLAQQSGCPRQRPHHAGVDRPAPQEAHQHRDERACGAREGIRAEPQAHVRGDCRARRGPLHGERGGPGLVLQPSAEGEAHQPSPGGRRLVSHTAPARRGPDGGGGGPAVPPLAGLPGQQLVQPVTPAPRGRPGAPAATQAPGHRVPLAPRAGPGRVAPVRRRLAPGAPQAGVAPAVPTSPRPYQGATGLFASVCVPVCACVRARACSDSREEGLFLARWRARVFRGVELNAVFRSALLRSTPRDPFLPQEKKSIA